MNELSLDEIRKRQDMLINKLLDYCDLYNIIVFFWAGSLLGAVRHNGPIPWDDDVDVAMIREDYERFIKLVKKSPIQDVELFELRNPNTKKYAYPFAKISDKSTIIFEDGVTSQGYGVFIDVFPIDKLPSNSLGKKIKVNLCRILFYSQYLALKTNLSRTSFKFFLHRLFKLVGAKRIGNIINRYAMYSSIKRNNNADRYCVLSHSSLARCQFEYADLFPVSKHMYSSLVVSIPNNYSKILTSQYGDYMTPPPKEAREFKHSFIAFYK